MNRLNRYIFKQLFFTSVSVAVVLTCVVWLAQSLRFVEMVANKGVSATLFFQMVFFLLPNLIIIVLPISALIGVLFIYNKLASDHELMVMQGSGVSAFQLLKPALFLALLLTILLYGFTLYLLPLSFSKFKDLEVSLKNETSASMMQPGEFNTFGKYTFFARTRTTNGVLQGLVVYDGSNPEKPATLLSERGFAIEEEDGFRMILQNGNRQEKSPKTGKPSILYFDKYTIVVKKPESTAKSRAIKPYERFLGDLFTPLDPTLSENSKLQLWAEGHNRIITPLYAFAFTLIGAACLLSGHYNRRGRSGKILMAGVAACFLQIMTLILLNSVKFGKFTVGIAYGLITLIVALAFYMMSDRGVFLIDNLDLLSLRRKSK
ncbi:LPS export ABC transporter permease LptF [Candidatus Bealeia paramacronuclearis]